MKNRNDDLLIEGMVDKAEAFKIKTKTERVILYTLRCIIILMHLTLPFLGYMLMGAWGILGGLFLAVTSLIINKNVMTIAINVMWPSFKDPLK